MTALAGAVPLKAAAATCRSPLPPLLWPSRRRRTNIAEGDESMEFETSKGVKVVSSFDAMGLREELLRGEQGMQRRLSAETGGGGAGLCKQTTTACCSRRSTIRQWLAAGWTLQKSIACLQFVSTAAACP